MKRLVLGMMVLGAATALAMPTKQQISKAQPLVVELMAPAMDDYKAKKKTAAEVADAAVAFAAKAETEAVKFMLYRSSIPYYVRGEAYDKAAEAVTLLRANVMDVPAEVIAEIISKATVRANREKAPRLFALYQQARTQATAEKDVKELRKKPASPSNKRKLAEALATTGDWPEALKEFANLRTDAAQMAKKEQDGSGKSYELGEFWWGYKPTYANAEDTFKVHAATHYRKALAAGEITGLKKDIVEQRICGIMPEASMASKNARALLEYKGIFPIKESLIWKGASLKEINKIDALTCGSCAGGHYSTESSHMKGNERRKTFQFQFQDGGYRKCVCIELQQHEDGVYGRAIYAKYKSEGADVDFDVDHSSNWWSLASSEKTHGYGIMNLRVVFDKNPSKVKGETSVSAAPAPVTKGGSAWQEKGNTATLDLGKGEKIEFVKCPPGEFKMLTDYGKYETVDVKMTRPFWISKTHMSKGQFQAAMNRPVDAATRTHRQSISRVKEQQEGMLEKMNCDYGALLPAGYVIRYPSIAEWEYAYHANTRDTNDPHWHTRTFLNASFDILKPKDENVGSTVANKWGITDLRAQNILMDRFDENELEYEGRGGFSGRAKKILKPQGTDPFYWTENDGYVCQEIGCSFDFRDMFSETKRDYTTWKRNFHLVVGPDLVSEWKAKHGGKK